MGGISIVRRRSRLRQILILVLAGVLLGSFAATPALAQAQQGLGQESSSGNVTPSFTATQSGDNSNQCVAPLQFGNTGSLQNSQGLLVVVPTDLQYRPRISIGDVQFGGSTFTFSPTVTVNCNQSVQQSAAASNTTSTDGCTWEWDGGWWCLWSDGSWWLWDSGSWTSWDSGWWYPADGGWWYWGNDGWWWYDGYTWTYYGWSNVSHVATGALDAAKGTTPLITLGGLALVGSAGILLRRRQRGEIRP